MAGLTAATSPLTARRRLANELRLLRDQFGYTNEDVGHALHCHPSNISRFETAKRTPSKADFTGLMTLYEVEGDRLEELTALLVRARQRVQPWWHAYNDVISAAYAEFLAYEAEAETAFEYQPLFAPAQFQTEAYARAVTAVGFAALGPDQVDALVEVKMRRQVRLQEEVPLLLDCVISEAALHFQVGGRKVMQAQLRRLQEVATLPHVSLGVVPFESGEAGLVTGSFTLFGTREDTVDVSFTESAEGTSFRDDPGTLRRLRRLFHNLSKSALPADQSLELLERIERELN